MKKCNAYSFIFILLYKTKKFKKARHVLKRTEKNN